MDDTPVLTINDFTAARERIAAHVVQTPASYHAPLNLAFKWENQQRTNSFKPRGALNKILTMPPEKLASGLVAASAGNHGQGLALAAQMTGTPVHIFVPQATATVKVERMLAFGATVEHVPGYFDRAEARARALAADSGAIYISPYNDLDVIAGAGTIALEWLKQAPDLRRWLLPLGGGGLIAGMGLVARVLQPDLEIIGVQSEASPYLYHQFYYGHMRDVVEQPSLTEGLAGDVEDGSVTIALLPQVCDGVVLVTEAEVRAAIAYAYHELEQVIEGSSAVGLAAVLANKIDTAARLTGALVTGGNIDPGTHAEICAQFK